jgi:hypothetical protein
MVNGRRHMKPFVGAPIRVSDEVRECFMEGSDRVVNILLKDEE